MEKKERFKMDNKTAKKAQLLDLTVSVLGLVQDGDRDIEEVCQVLKTIKDSSDFFRQFFIPLMLVSRDQHRDVSKRLDLSWVPEGFEVVWDGQDYAGIQPCSQDTDS